MTGIDSEALLAYALAVPVTRVEFDQTVEEKLDTLDGDDDYTGWWCVATADYPCPAESCSFVAHHMTAAHMIIVWPDLDDASMLAHAANAKMVGRDPRIVEYQDSFGGCISWDRWVSIGRPVHGIGPRPDGYDGRAHNRDRL